MENRLIAKAVAGESLNINAISLTPTPLREVVSGIRILKTIFGLTSEPNIEIEVAIDEASVLNVKSVIGLNPGIGAVSV